MKEKTAIAILGATGSIGTQALDVVRLHPNRFTIVALSANTQVEQLVTLAREFSPKIVAIANETLYPQLKNALSGTNTIVLAGSEGLNAVATFSEADVVISSLVGIAGLKPTLAAIEQGKTIGLANKEVLVAAGSYVMTRAKACGATIIPVDSEHSAIYQCLLGETLQPEELWLTASGGPFRNAPLKALQAVTPQQALNHPRWIMGKKVTIDSSTLANKGFEVIEARWLFDIPAERIKVLIHPESIVHSLVSFCDGSVKAQLAEPDMRLPISLALGLGSRVANNYPRLNLFSSALHFEEPNFENFPMLKIAYQALRTGGNAPAVLNAADSVAVQAFLEGKIGFLDIPRLVDAMFEQNFVNSNDSLDSVLQTTNFVTQAAHKYIQRYYM